MWGYLNLCTHHMYVEKSLRLGLPVDELQIDGSTRAEQAVGFGLDVSGQRRRADVELLNELHKKEKCSAVRKFEYMHGLVEPCDLDHGWTEMCFYPCQSQVHLELCYSPADAASDAVAKGDGAKVVDAVSGIFPYPAIWFEFWRIGEVFFIKRCGVVTQGQLSLTVRENKRKNCAMKTSGVCSCVHTKGTDGEEAWVSCYICFYCNVFGKLSTSTRWKCFRFLTPLGMKYPPSTKSSWVTRPLPGSTGKSLLPEWNTKTVIQRTFGFLNFLSITEKDKSKWNPCIWM